MACASRSSCSSRENINGSLVPIVEDDVTFEALQRRRMCEMESRMKEDIKRKRHEWEKDLDKMRKEFLRLSPAEPDIESDELVDDPFVRKRRGSTDILDRRKMKTLYMNYSESGRKFKLRFDVREFEPSSVRVSTDVDRIIVRATKIEKDDTRVDYIRKIAKPRDVKVERLTSLITSDRILIVEAQLPPPHLGKLTSSPSRSSHGTGSNRSMTSSTKSRSRSNSASPSTPSVAGAAKPKYNLPTFHGDDDARFLSLIIDIGDEFNNKEITVQIINDSCIQVKAKHEERSSDRLKKCKYFKEYELGEKIETYSLRAGLTKSGKLVVGALGKGNTSFASKSEVGEAVANDIKSVCSKESVDIQSCNVLDLASFPPTAAPPL